MLRRIYWNIVLIICFVSIFILGNQIVIHQFQVSSDKLLLEYHELYAIQDFKVSFLHFQNHLLEAENMDIDHIHIDSVLVELEIKKENCENLVTQTHLNEQWEDLLSQYQVVKEKLNNTNIKPAYAEIKSPIDEILSVLKNMILETNEEIIETEEKNKTIQKHGSITLLLTGILFIILIMLISLFTAKNITTPIREFLSTFDKLGKGEKKTRVNISSKNEFGKLANEFNSMFDKLDNTTVTLEYVRSIIDNIFGGLFVTDEEGYILSCNKIAMKLLGYKEQELVGKHISILFNWEGSTKDNVDLTFEKKRQNQSYPKN